MAGLVLVYRGGSHSCTDLDLLFALGKASGKRKLDFGGQRFRGKSFFLDLRGYRHAHDIETELIQRGAVSSTLLFCCMCRRAFRVGRM